MSEAYAKYLQSDHWKALRLTAIERDGHKCTRCGAVVRLNVHHEVYRSRWEDGILDDVRTLCQTCHRIEHGLRVITDFDRKYRELDMKLRYEVFPTQAEQRQLVGLIVWEEEAQRACALFRNIATMRIITTSTRMWDSWLKKSSTVKGRLWRWSENKLNRLDMEVSNVGQTL